MRVSLATLRNLCACDDAAEPAEVEASAAVTTTLIGMGLPKTLGNMKERSWADPDVVADVEAVHQVLMDNFRELSTFDRWAAECSNKALKWGSKLVHCDKFWRENCKVGQGLEPVGRRAPSAGPSACPPALF